LVGVTRARVDLVERGMVFAVLFVINRLDRTDMPILRNAVPLASVAALTLVAALPFGMPAEVRFYMPLLPYTVIHYWAVRRPTLMPEWGVFLAGLGTDALTHGPLGFWSLMFLIGVVAVDATRDAPDWGAVGRWGVFSGTLLALGVCQWLVASVYFVEWADWKPMLLAVIIAVLSYPVIGSVLRPLNRLWASPENAAMTRGGEHAATSRGHSPVTRGG
jgi:rod shape-determining protein MreD